MPDTLPVARFQDTLPRQQTNYAPSHIGTDPLAYLPDRAADRLRRLQLSADDLHAVIPEFEQVREANAARMEADTRLKRLLAPQSSGGFNLPEDDLRVTVARRELAEKGHLSLVGGIARAPRSGSQQADAAEGRIFFMHARITVLKALNHGFCPICFPRSLSAAGLALSTAKPRALSRRRHKPSGIGVPERVQCRSYRCSVSRSAHWQSRS
jgi:hypothetical protein